MIQLEDLKPTAAVRGILPDSLVTVVSVQCLGSEALGLTYKAPAGKVANELLFRQYGRSACNPRAISGPYRRKVLSHKHLLLPPIARR